MTNAVWKVEQLLVRPVLDTMTDVVSEVQWGCSYELPEGIGAVHGWIKLNIPTDQSFVAFDNLTEEMVISWVKDTLGSVRVTEIEIAAIHQAQNIVNPDQTARELPWTK